MGTTVLVRVLHSLINDDYTQLCWKTHLWGQQGYMYTWSFFMGTGYLMLLWLMPGSPCRAPFFRKWSTGFWFIMVLGMALVACLYQTFFLWDTASTVLKPLDCSDDTLEHFKTFSRAMRARNLFAPNQAYGLCTPSANDLLTGVTRDVAEMDQCAWQVYQSNGPYKIPLQGTSADVDALCGK